MALAKEEMEAKTVALSGVGVSAPVSAAVFVSAADRRQEWGQQKPPQRRRLRLRLCCSRSCSCSCLCPLYYCLYQYRMRRRRQHQHQQYEHRGWH
jgi:hypothetical protein